MAQSRVERAQRRLAAQDIAGARRDCEAILGDSRANARDRAGAHLVLATCSQRSADQASALSHVRSAIDLNAGDPVAHYALAELLESGGDKAAAMASLRRAIALNANFVQAWNYLGILLGESGDDAGAATAFEHTVRLDPGHARAWNNLGNAQRSLGQLDEAGASFARALILRPDYPLAAANLASVQRDLGDSVRAETTVREAIARIGAQAPHRPLLVILAGLLRDRGAFDEAAQVYVQAINLAPDQSAAEWIGLARVLSERGETERTREAFARAHALDATDLRSALGAALALPMVYTDVDALAAARAAYRSGLDHLNRNFETLVGGLSEQQVLDGLRWTNFFLAYQGEDDRALQQDYATFAARAIDTVAPQWRVANFARREAGARIRVGFASAFFHVGTVGRYFSSWVTDLDRARFEVFVYHLYPAIDEVGDALQARADCFRPYRGRSARPSVVAPDIRADHLDVLIYPELGMDATSFALAALRLAPVQYAAWGHPMTTGHATIDGYFSCDAMEPADAQAHYTEKLMRLPGIGTRYSQPAIPAGATRQAFGLPDDVVLLLCPQSLFKVHPENDELFARILERNPETLLILFAGRHPAITDQFMRRLARAFDRHGLPIRERARVLPPLPHDDFLRINLVCDAMLDTLHWSGGNTSLDALACALPIVTLPGAYMRGRQSAGMLSLLGVRELIAHDVDDYVAIANRVIAEPEWRRALSERIGAGRERLFDVRDAVVRLEEVLQASVVKV